MNNRIIDSGAMVLSMAILLSTPTSSSSQVLAKNSCNSYTMDSLKYSTSSSNRYEFRIYNNRRNEALDLFGVQRQLTPLEIIDYNKMLEKHSVKTGVNIFELYS